MTDHDTHTISGPSQKDKGTASREDEDDKEITPDYSSSPPRNITHISPELEIDLRTLITEETARAQETSASLFLLRATHVGVPNLDHRLAIERFGYKEFSICKPPDFTGVKEPIISYRWDRAKEWWDVVIRTKGSDVVKNLTWDEFKEIFLKNFSPEAWLKKLRREFLNIKQMNKTVNEFIGNFLDQAWFCPEYMENVKRLMDHYHEALRKEIREFFQLQNFKTFDQLVNAARERELETIGGSSSGGDGGSRREEHREERRDFPICGICARNHLGECWQEHKQGYLRSECPDHKNQGNVQGGKKKTDRSQVEPVRPVGHSVHIAANEAQQASDVLTSTFLVNSIHARILLGS
ncbi:zinc finger, CCHC-type, retrotransposon gag domain protein [Tanacetum coccineum]